MALGINHVVSLIVIMVITFYFARRFDGEGVPGKDINEKVKALEEEIKEIPKTPLVPVRIPHTPLQPGQVVVKPPI